MKFRRVRGFVGLVRLLGLGRARRVARGWREALEDRPELVADLAMLGFLDESAMRLRAGRPAPLPADELQFREGARSVARAIMDRAGLTEDDIRLAMQEIDDALDLDDALRGAYPQQ